MSAHDEIEILAVRYGVTTISERVDGEILVYRECWGPGSVKIPKGFVPLLRHHDRKMPVGRLDDFRETEDGLVCSGRLVGSAVHREDVSELVRGGLIGAASIGFFLSPLDQWSAPTSPRGLPTVVRRSVELREVSLVPRPAVEGSGVLKISLGSRATGAVPSRADLAGWERAALVSRLSALDDEHALLVSKGIAPSMDLVNERLAIAGELRRRAENARERRKLLEDERRAEAERTQRLKTAVSQREARERAAYDRWVDTLVAAKREAERMRLPSGLYADELSDEFWAQRTADLHRYGYGLP